MTSDSLRAFICYLFSLILVFVYPVILEAISSFVYLLVLTNCLAQTILE